MHVYVHICMTLENIVGVRGGGLLYQVLCPLFLMTGSLSY